MNSYLLVEGNSEISIKRLSGCLLAIKINKVAEELLETLKLEGRKVFPQSLRESRAFLFHR
jgi:hypothetical protein